MATSKPAEKQARVSVKKRLRNKSVRSEVKTNITKAEKLVFSGEMEAARAAVVAAISSLDNASEKGVLHGNNAARRKSRLMKKLNQALALAETKTEPEETE